MYWEPATAAESAAEGRTCRTAAEQWEDAQEKEFGVDGLPLIMRWVSAVHLHVAMWWRVRRISDVQHVRCISVCGALRRCAACAACVVAVSGLQFEEAAHRVRAALMIIITVADLQAMCMPCIECACIAAMPDVPDSLLAT
jgi:hypothetical protein